MLIAAHCDLCGGTVFLPLYSATIDPKVDPAEYYSTMRARAGHFSIVRCRGCGLVLSSPRDAPGTLQAIYSDLADPSYDAESQNRRWVARQRAAQLSDRFHPGRLLDVGCSTGVFAAEAARVGWDVTGLDPSTQAINQARQKSPQSVFVVGPVESANFGPQSFDLITLWDVLEHLPSPTMVLTMVKPWLRPGGWLLMNIPDVASLPARWMGRRWVLLLREHIWYFSPATIRMLCQKTGYGVNSIHSNWVRFSLGGIAARLQQYPGLGQSVGNRLARLGRLTSLTVRFPMGEMTVLAQLEEPGILNGS
jgi:ubiquinone/menaquinone biosynthesis C-methylase UbiE